MKHTKDFIIETLHVKLRYPSLDDIPAIFKVADYLDTVIDEKRNRLSLGVTDAPEGHALE
ncbi:MAG: hypothetical protein ACJAR1_001601 [Rubritalea sp.]|jgi:hypothetical protein